MSDGRVFTIITVYDDGGYVSHFNWEIRTRGAIIRNKMPIKSDKNTCYNSLVLHTKNFLGIKLDRNQVRNIKQGSAGYEKHS